MELFVDAVEFTKFSFALQGNNLCVCLSFSTSISHPLPLSAPMSPLYHVSPPMVIIFYICQH